MGSGVGVKVSLGSADGCVWMSWELRGERGGMQCQVTKEVYVRTSPKG